MNFKRTPELLAFLSTYIANADMEEDEKATLAFIAASSPERQQQVIAQATLLLKDSEFPIEELGTEANRWFGEAEEARAWLGQILNIIEAKQAGAHAATDTVKDSNGTPLAEGDSVQVIKDLKVKGGSSDLKRGTLIKKIHLIGDPEAVECRVDGSTLVLKTCFLKLVPQPKTP
ncbi:alkylphosphonate utilization protein [Bdellovibrionota bacterium FG-1]